MEVAKKNDKKPTNAQLQRRIDTAILHIDRTKDTKTIYFDDRGLRLTLDEHDGIAIIETGGHRHIFNQIVGSNISMPYLHTKWFMEIAQNNLVAMNITDKNGNVVGKSYEKLLKALEEKEDDHEYVTAWYFDKWLHCIYAPLYDIGDDVVSSMVVFENYCHTLARHHVFAEERKEDLTKKQYVSKICDLVKQFTENITDDVMIKALSDEERVKQELDALQKDMEEQVIQQQGQDEGKDDK